MAYIITTSACKLAINHYSYKLYEVMCQKSIQPTKTCKKHEARGNTMAHKRILSSAFDEISVIAFKYKLNIYRLQYVATEDSKFTSINAAAKFYILMT